QLAPRATIPMSEKRGLTALRVTLIAGGPGVIRPGGGNRGHHAAERREVVLQPPTWRRGGAAARCSTSDRRPVPGGNRRTGHDRKHPAAQHRRAPSIKIGTNATTTQTRRWPLSLR